MTAGRVGEKAVVLIKPQTYMNRSGDALACVGDVADMDIEVGRIRVKFGGGTAGHRGLDSIVEHFGPDFTRVRIGVGRPPRGEDAVDFVLSRFTSDELDVVEEAVRRAADAVECVLQEGTSAAMNRFNALPQSRT